MRGDSVHDRVVRAYQLPRAGSVSARRRVLLRPMLDLCGVSGEGYPDDSRMADVPIPLMYQLLSNVQC